MTLIPEIEARLKAKCDRLVSAFETDETGELHIHTISSFLLLALTWCFGRLVRFAIFLHSCCELPNTCIQ